MILTFSGTGNSLYVAKKLASATHDTLLNLTPIFRGEPCPELTGEKRLILVTPTYAWRIPRLVSDWLERTTLPRDADMWFVMTCGSEIGDAGRYNRELCEKKALRYRGTAQIVMPENYIAMFNAPGRSEAGRILERAEPVIRKTGEYILRGESFPEKRITVLDKAMSALVNPGFYPLVVKDKGFYVTASCSGCGKCARLCPTLNIRMENGKPRWQGKCTQCMACICRCPQEAIEYGKKSKGKVRYHLD